MRLTASEIANAELVAACAQVARDAIANAEPPLNLSPAEEDLTVSRSIEKLLAMGVYLDGGLLRAPASKSKRLPH